MYSDFVSNIIEEPMRSNMKKVFYNLKKATVLFFCLTSLFSCKNILNVQEINDQNTNTEENQINNIKQILNLDSISPSLKVNYEGFVSKSIDEIYTKWPQYNEALAADTHGDVVKISYVKKISDNEYIGNSSSLVLSELDIPSDSYLVFDYKCSFYTNCYDETEKTKVINKPYISESYVTVYVNDIPERSLGYMGNSIWQTTGIKLLGNPEKKYTIKWDLPMQKYRFTNVENCIYIDNVRIVSKDDYEKVDLSPKGQQDVYIGDYLNFSASADWSDSKPVYTVSGGGTIDENGKFTASTAGTYTITASIDGKTASNTTVTVHDPALAAQETVESAGYKFTGKVSNIKDGHEFYNQTLTGSFDEEVLNIIDLSVEGRSNQYLEFDADGFFYLKGTVKDKDKNYFLRLAFGNGGKITSFQLNGDFTQRVWLRFGTGKYYIYLDSVNYYMQGDTLYYRTSPVSSYPLYVVNNTNNISELDALYLLPSSIVQSDSFEVSNAVHDALYGHETASTGEKLQLTYTWLTNHLYYDFSSAWTTERKPQESVYCIKNRYAVCEGFANAYAAMTRYCGIPAKVFSGTGTSSTGTQEAHAWNNILYNNKWYLADPTWDCGAYDPDKSLENKEIHPYDETYSYFLLSNLRGYNNDHTPTTVEKRSISGEELPPYNRDMPEGWY